MLGQLPDLAFADERRRRGRVPFLDERVEHQRACGFSQFAKFNKRILNSPPVVTGPFQSNQQRPLLQPSLRIVVRLQRFSRSL